MKFTQAVSLSRFRCGHVFFNHYLQVLTFVVETSLISDHGIRYIFENFRPAFNNRKTMFSLKRCSFLIFHCQMVQIPYFYDQLAFSMHVEGALGDRRLSTNDLTLLQAHYTSWVFHLSDKGCSFYLDWTLKAANLTHFKFSLTPSRWFFEVVAQFEKTLLFLNSLRPRKRDIKRE